MRSNGHALDPDVQLMDDVNEAWLFHGTTYENADSIVQSGFDPRVCRRGMYGVNNAYPTTLLRVTHPLDRRIAMEPDGGNEHDPNAIKVVTDHGGSHGGWLHQTDRQGSCYVDVCLRHLWVQGQLQRQTVLFQQRLAGTCRVCRLQFRSSLPELCCAIPNFVSNCTTQHKGA